MLITKTLSSNITLEIYLFLKIILLKHKPEDSPYLFRSPYYWAVCDNLWSNTCTDNSLSSHFLPPFGCLLTCYLVSDSPFKGGFIFVHFNETLNKRLLNRIVKVYYKKYNIPIHSAAEINVINKDHKIQKTRLRYSFSTKEERKEERKKSNHRSSFPGILIHNSQLQAGKQMETKEIIGK